MMVRLSQLLACVAATVDHLEAESSIRLTRARMLELMDALEGISADRAASAQRFDEADERVAIGSLFDGFDQAFPAIRPTVHHPRWLLPDTDDPDDFGIGLARALVAYARLAIDGRGPSCVRPRPALSQAAKTQLLEALWSGLLAPLLARARAMRVRIREAALIARADIAFRPAFGRGVAVRAAPALN